MAAREWRALRASWLAPLEQHGWDPANEVKHEIKTGYVPPALADAVIDGLSRPLHRVRDAARPRSRPDRGRSELAELPLLHYDRHFEVVGELTSQPVEALAPPCLL